MKRNSRITSAVVLAASLALAVGPAYPGGRDVPDAENSNANETEYRPLPAPSRCDDAYASVNTGLVPVEVRTNAAGKTTVTPGFFRQIGRLFSWAFGTDSGGSCSS